jgi:hypothetical protein
MMWVEDTQKVSEVRRRSWQRVHKVWVAGVRIRVSKEQVDLGHIVKIETSSREIGASAAAVQHKLEHVRRRGSVVAGLELVADKPQGYMAGDLRTPKEAYYKVVEGIVHLG